ncbi:putative PEP-binding protein [Shigella flexneri]
MTSAQWTSEAIKALPYLNIPQEDNPFLAIARYIFTRELWPVPHSTAGAICALPVFGNAQLMIPMVHSLDQILWVKARSKKRSLSLA